MHLPSRHPSRLLAFVLVLTLTFVGPLCVMLRAQTPPGLPHGFPPPPRGQPDRAVSAKNFTLRFAYEDKADKKPAGAQTALEMTIVSSGGDFKSRLPAVGSFELSGHFNPPEGEGPSSMIFGFVGTTWLATPPPSGGNPTPANSENPGFVDIPLLTSGTVALTAGKPVTLF